MEKLLTQAWAASASVDMKDAKSVRISFAHYPHTFIDNCLKQSFTYGAISVVVCDEKSETPSGFGTFPAQ
jgi:hypothetical protein